MFTTAPEQAETFTGKIGIDLGADAGAVRADDYAQRSLARWVFSPFASIDLTDHVVTGHARIQAGAFVRVKNQAYYRNHSIDLERLAKGTFEAGGLTQLERTAYDIAKELEDRYSDTGFVTVAGLTGIDDAQTVGNLQQVLLGDDLPFAVDKRLGDDAPVPVLPVWLNRLNDFGRANVAQLSGDVRTVCEQAMQSLRLAITRAITHATNETESAKRALATGRNARPFSRVVRRAFLALGEEIPNDLPMVAGSQNQMQNGLIADLVGNLTAALKGKEEPQVSGEVAELRRELEELKNLMRVPANPSGGEAAATVSAPAPITEPKPDYSAETCAGLNARGEACKSRVVKELDGLYFCHIHPKEA